MALTKLNNQSLNAVTSAGIPMPSGAFIRQYSGVTSTPVARSGNTDTLLTISNVVVNPGENVFFAYHISDHNGSSTNPHSAVRVEYTNNSTNVTKSIGHSAWGLGISDTKSDNWQLLTGFLNLTNYHTSPWTDSGTFTVVVKIRGNTNSGYFGGEGSGTKTEYTPAMASLMIAAA
tara:strand:+ start:130 stop:654 length:525 start_codon:yes stop_codon:yes gene_type:complete